MQVMASPRYQNCAETIIKRKKRHFAKCCSAAFALLTADAPAHFVQAIIRSVLECYYGTALYQFS